ncbi:hypothetical protein N7539_007442 [Penicillium diatomitis]|uniref:Pentatricopeptide repeat domain-containing protein n=1 Tax=Penicillium diatomitis TaxID=2819901 RepID=A0A9W9WV53_9EURO|nr:uncharacterized protein N7539_007442 [Penicillium diatomitis]KAJ5477298.1 hypothetical protein N7539_007442 [Penicillium diatomitis]
MRPALLRLLKRPSAVSVLDTLAATPTGIEQLRSTYTQLRHQSRCAQQNELEDHGDTLCPVQEARSLQQTGDGQKFNFNVYEIETVESEPVRDVVTGKRADSASKSPVDFLRMQSDFLEFESDIGHCNDIGSRLVDQDEHKNNFELWEELLKFRQRHYGDRGTQDIWEGLRARVTGVQLPVSGVRADLFWLTFTRLGVRRDLFLQDVMDYAIEIYKKDGSSWPHLYHNVVGGLLHRGLTKRALRWNKIFQTSGLARPDDVLQLLLPVIQPHSLVENAQSWYRVKVDRPSLLLRTFRLLCRAAVGHKIYGRVIATLIQHGYGEGAISIHPFLIARGDEPKTRSEIQPLLDYARMYGFWDENKKLQSYAQNRFDITSTAPSESSAGETSASASESKPFKDDIGARLLATRALNFDVVLGGMKMLGVSAIGSRSLRELALRAHGSQDVLDKIKALRQAGISLRDSVFARLVQKLASQSRDILLSDLLHSDQHPDALEDKAVQESLLVSYYMARDMHQYNLALAVLAELYPHDPDLLDIHFRKHIAAGDWGAASKIVDDLTLRKRSLSADSLDFMAEKVLTPRRPNHRPHAPSGQPLDTKREVMFVFHVLQRSVQLCGYVNPSFWKELLKRLGMENHWDELRECTLWLVRQYGTENRKLVTATAAAHSMSHDHRMLKLIFTPPMQAALVAWGFLVPVSTANVYNAICFHPKSQEPLIQWVRGILLLRELEEIGLTLHKRVIVGATRHRLATLYGKFQLSHSRTNRVLRKQNPYRWQRVAEECLRAWGDPSFFGGLERIDPVKLMNPGRTPSSLKRSAQIIWPRKRARRPVE